jgi:hypothetical protein
MLSQSERLREGDVVVLHATVTKSEACGSVDKFAFVRIHGDGVIMMLDRKAVQKIVSHRFEVGDLVTKRGFGSIYRIIALHELWAWVADHVGCPEVLSISEMTIHTRREDRKQDDLAREVSV